MVEEVLLTQQRVQERDLQLVPSLLRGGVTAMPVILTLQSGAALARSSNLISTASPDTTDALGRTLCLNTNTVSPASDAGQAYDMGDPPSAEVTILRERRYVNRRRRPRRRVAKSDMCLNGGKYWYNDRNGLGWQSVEMPANGVVVSSGAMTSMADYVIETLI